jgi:hypothetical protein
MRAKLILFALILCAGSASAQPVDIRQGLVAYWPLDATDGLTTADASAFANHLNLANMDASNFVPGKYGNAARFNGADEMLNSIYTVGAGNGLPIHGARYYTVMLWVNGVGATQGDRRVFSEGSMTATAPLFSIGTDNAGVPGRTNVVDMFVRNDGNTALINHRKSAKMAFDGTWHHVAWVEEDGTARLYVDGELDVTVFNYSRAGSAFTFNTIALGALQRGTPTSYYSGLIDDAAIWERPLSQAEIQQVMTNSLGTPIGPFPPLLLSQPASGNRGPGDRITFATRAVGNRPLSYQWFKGENVIDGAIGPSYTISNISAAAEGDFKVVVSNLTGSVTSAVATLTFVPDPTNNLRAGLISYWPLNEVDTDGLSPFRTPDVYSHNDMSLQTAGFFEQPAGAFGSALGFNGLDQYALRRSGFPIYSNPGLSVSLWVNAMGTGQSDRRFFAESSTNNTNPLFVFGTQATGTNGTIRVFIRGDAGGTPVVDRHSTRSPLDGTWHHVVWTETNGQGKLYIDGVLDETDFAYTRVPTTLNQTALGTIVRSTLAPFFTGALDEVAVWNRVLTYSEIQDIFSVGVPGPVGDTPPEITQHPASQSIFTRGRATFRFVATGTAPLTAQWRKDAQDLLNQTNDTLVVTNATLADAGEYDVVVSNSAGSVTSLVATLTVSQRPAAPESLRIDFNDTLENTPVQTESGFHAFALPAVGPGPVMQFFGGAEVTVAGAGVTLESRRRATPVNSGTFTEEQLLRDFIFARDTLAGEGLDLTIEFMESNQLYAATIWSFDSGSASPARISDWFANGSQVVTGYTMINTELPTTNERWRMNFDVVSDADGKIVIQGRRSPLASAAINVFLNAVRLEKPTMRIHEAYTPDGFDFYIVIEVIDSALPHRIQEKADLAQADWTDSTDVTWTILGGRMLQAIVPFVPETRFYRVVEGPAP